MKSKWNPPLFKDLEGQMRKALSGPLLGVILLPLFAVVGGAFRHSNGLVSIIAFVAFVMMVLTLMSSMTRVYLVTYATKVVLSAHEDVQKKHGEVCWKQLLDVYAEGTPAKVLPEIVYEGLLYAVYLQRKAARESHGQGCELYRRTTDVQAFFRRLDNEGARCVLDLNDLHHP